MLRTLSSPSADYAGHVQIDIRPVIESGTVARRVSRIATLDGSAVVNDGGYSDTDRTIDLRWQAARIIPFHRR